MKLRRVGLIAALIGLYLKVLHPRVRNWGASEEETSRHLPGDGFVPDPKITATNAITIHATPADIWPWLVQMGTGRAGWYSFDMLDNKGVSSADEIIPDFQTFEAGGMIPAQIATESQGKGFQVVACEQEKALGLLSTWDVKERKSVTDSDLPEVYLRRSWVFILEPVDERFTRLIVRTRTAYSAHPVAVSMAHTVLDSGQAIMQRKQLLNIKKRVEQKRTRDLVEVISKEDEELPTSP